MLMSQLEGKPMEDFRVEDHGTIWVVTAKTPAAQACFEDLNYADVIIGDWRPTWHACQELYEQGFTFKCTSKTAQKLIEEGKPW
jgi:hypothetical protein